MTSAKMSAGVSVDAAAVAFDARAVNVALAEKPEPFTMVMV
jgi:hypothetical protein